jgi:DNA-binding CsgD family transcriptional regulator
MNILSFLSIFAGSVSLIIGIHIYRINKKDILHQIFFLSSLFLCFWLFSISFSYGAETISTFSLWFQISFPGFFLYYAAVLHFSIRLYRRKRPSLILISALYTIAFSAAVFSIMQSDTYFANFIKGEALWRFIYAYANPVFFLTLSYSLIILGSSFCLLMSWAKRKKTKREHFHSNLILSIFTFIFIMSITEGFLLPQLTEYESIGILPFLIFFWHLGLFYSMFRYNFISLTPLFISREIVNQLDEVVLIFSPQLKLLSVNSNAEPLLKNDGVTYIGKTIQNVLEGADKLKNRIMELKTEDLSSFSCRIHLKEQNHSSENSVYDAKVSVVRDKYGDELAVLIIGRRIRKPLDLRERFRLTERELQITEEIINGNSNKDISNKLNISERTVKTHITHIYRKLNIKNKVQLLRILRKYNMVPQKASGRDVLT